MALDKKQQQTVALTVMGAAFFFYIYWSYGLKPVNEKISRTSQELKTVTEKVDSMKRTAQRLPALKKEYESLQAEVGQTEKRLPQEKSLEEVLRIVTEQSLKYRVSVASFAPGSGKQETYYLEIPITMNVQGQFHTLGKFLTALGLQERILSARNLSLTYAPNPKKNHTVTGTFTLLAFSFKG
jgi:type IV pilus assembly protein PilO